VAVKYHRVEPSLTEITRGLRFPEGPIAMPGGDFIVVEIGGKALTRVGADGRHMVIADLDGGPNGAAVGADGWCYLCNSGGWQHREVDGVFHVTGQSADNGWIERVHPETGEVQRLYEACDGRPLRAPNDLVFDRHGGFYFTDHGKADRYQRDVTAVYYALPDGSAIREVARPFISPNGIGLSPDEGTLYVAETQTRRLWGFSLAEPGVIDPIPWPDSINGGHLVAGLPDRHGLDSLAVDSAGHICIGSLGNGGIWSISPDGGERVFYPMADPYVTNVCFGGADLRTGYVTLSGTGRLASFEWPRPGLPLNFLNR
jgi:gluconolactonase